MLTKELKTWGEITGWKNEGEAILSLNVDFSKNVNVICLLIDSKYLLSICYVPNTILDISDVSENKRDNNSFLKSIYIWVDEMEERLDFYHVEICFTRKLSRECREVRQALALL